jgi:peptidoglycan/xylan/chitin deacetylase (PgdA/CDA1 family)
LRELVNRELSEGNTVGDHGDQHKPYDLRMLQGVVLENGFTATEADTEIRRSIELLDNATGEQFSKQKNLLFRFPYGRGAIPSPEELDHMEHDKIHPFRFRSQNFNDRLLQYKKQNSAVASIAGFGFSHIGWNHDSLDTDGRTVSLKDYVKGNIQRFCESKEKIQVALFHDIKAINAEAIPLIIDIGKCLGLDFVSTEKMIQESKYLTTKGVLIPKDFQLKGVVHEATHIGDVINKTPGPTCQLQEAVEKTPCVSSNGSTYQHCTGDEYICINGSWIIKAQVLLDGLCR